MLFITRKIGFIHAAHLVFFKLQPMLQVLLNIKGIALVVVCGQLVVRMLRDVVFIREERTDTAKLEDALAAVQHGELIHTHKLLAELLVIEGITP